MRKHQSLSKIVFAILLLLLGVYLLLINVGAISLEINSVVHIIYPYILFILGLIIFFRDLITKRKFKFFGFFLLIFSSLLICDQYELVSFRFWDFWKLWPIVFIYLGLKLFFEKKDFILIKNNKRKKNNIIIIKNNKGKKIFDDQIEKKNNKKEKDQSKTDRNHEIDQLIEEIFKDGVFLNGLDQEELKQKIHNYINAKFSKKQKEEMINDDFDVDVEDDFSFAKDNNSNFTNNKKKKRADQIENINILGLSIGNVEFKEPNWPLESMNLKHTVGNYYIDFSKAFIPDGESIVNLKMAIGDVDILIPEDIPVKMKVKVSIGEVKIFDQSYDQIGKGNNYSYVSEDYDWATRKIQLNIDLSIGIVCINQV